MSSEDVSSLDPLRLLTDCGAVIENSHFVYASGLHGSAYVNKNVVLDDPERMRALCGHIVSRFADVPYDVVVGPESGGIKIADGVSKYVHETVLRKSKLWPLHAMKTPEGGFAMLPHDIPLFTGRRVLVVEDVLTTGGSCRKVVDLIRHHGGSVVGVGAFVNRGKVTAEALSNVPRLVSLVSLQLSMWEEMDCPMCQTRVPVRTDLGKGRAFLDRVGAKQP